MALEEVDLGLDGQDWQIQYVSSQENLRAKQDRLARGGKISSRPPSSPSAGVPTDGLRHVTTWRILTPPALPIVFAPSKPVLSFAPTTKLVMPDNSCMIVTLSTWIEEDRGRRQSRLNL